MRIKCVSEMDIKICILNALMRILKPSGRNLLHAHLVHLRNAHCNMHQMHIDAHLETYSMRHLICAFNAFEKCAIRYASDTHRCASENIFHKTSQMLIKCISGIRITENVLDPHQMRFKNTSHLCPILCAFENAFETHH